MYEIISFKKKTNIKTNRALALGNFDGLHLGHRAILSVVKKQRDLIHTSITFLEPPIKYIKNLKNIQLITTLEERLQLFAEAGMEEVILLDFLQMQNQTAKEYVIFLKETLKCKFVASGENHKFGLNRAGNIHLLKDNFIVNTQTLIKNEKSENISSSLIREYFENFADIKIINKMLGYDFFVLGDVVEGLKKGSCLLGFPTLNAKYPENKVQPKLGVYAGFVELENKIIPSAINLGFAPTLKNLHEPIIEAHLLIDKLDFTIKPQQKIKVKFTKFIRDEKKFSNWEELKFQIQNDCEQIQKTLMI